MERSFLQGLGERFSHLRVASTKFEVYVTTRVPNCNQHLACDLCRQESNPSCWLLGLVWIGSAKDSS